MLESFPYVLKLIYTEICKNLFLDCYTFLFRYLSRMLSIKVKTEIIHIKKFIFLTNTL